VHCLDCQTRAQFTRCLSCYRNVRKEDVNAAQTCPDCLQASAHGQCQAKFFYLSSRALHERSIGSEVSCVDCEWTGLDSSTPLEVTVDQWLNEV
jgi:predicted RNA-binding Zn-ribbon protein involved in translation (DUF1610 family)